MAIHCDIPDIVIRWIQEEAYIVTKEQIFQLEKNKGKHSLWTIKLPDREF